MAAIESNIHRLVPFPAVIVITYIGSGGWRDGGGTVRRSSTPSPNAAVLTGARQDHTTSLHLGLQLDDI